MTITNPQKYMLGIAFVLLIAILPWLFLLAPELKKIPGDFSYEADVFSLDNFYDEEKGKFLGKNISKTKFLYETISQEGDVLVIKNVFDVRQLTGEKIFAVERIYGIDAKTGRHVKGHGDKDRSGFLFAPMRSNKGEYVYWHINYDAPANMVFQGVEKIIGLSVYRYESNYEADQTENLGHLPGVPESRGVRLDINLQVWIEPVSGRMVKYEDKTLAYYYDIQTGERLNPWNNFNNKFTKSSIADQVRISQKAKLRILLIDFIVPALFGLGALAMISWVYLGRKKILIPKKEGSKIEGKKRWIRVLVTVIVIILVAVGGFIAVTTTILRQDKITTISIARWVSNPEFDRNIEGFKDGLAENGYVEGKNIKFIIENPQADLEVQQNIVESFVEAEVDLIYSLTTPGTLVAKGVTSRIPIVFSIVTYPLETNVIGSLNSSGNNLVGTRNYVSPSKQYFAFESIYPHTKTLAFVHRKGEPNSVIQYNEFRKLLGDRGLTLLDIAAVDLDDMREQLESNLDVIDSMYSACDTLIQSGGEEVVIEYSMKYKKPSFTCNKDGVVKGALVGNITDFYTIGKISGEKAALILQGSEPTWLLTESPREDYIIINKKTSEELGITIPDDLLSRVREVITE